MKEGIAKANFRCKSYRMMQHDTLRTCCVHGYFVVLFSEVQMETLAEEGEPQGSSRTQYPILQRQHATHEVKEGVAKADIRCKSYD